MAAISCVLRSCARAILGGAQIVRVADGCACVFFRNARMFLRGVEPPPGVGMPRCALFVPVRKRILSRASPAGVAGMLLMAGKGGRGKRSIGNDFVQRLDATRDELCPESRYNKF